MVGGWTNRLSSTGDFGRIRDMDGWMDGWMAGWLAGWMNGGWVDGWMDGWMDEKKRIKEKH